jgi:hypothetical protein
MMISVFLTIFLAGSVVAGQPASGQCALCHPAERVAFEHSIHAKEEIRCTDCHGGNAEARDIKPAHGGNFRTLTDRKSIPELCATCHSNSSMMRPYNLPTEQFLIYQTSNHGQALARGLDTAAVCSDCHGAHDILPATDPASRVYPRNLADTCASCHADEALMEPVNLSSTVVEDYRNSIHGNALLDQGNSAAPDCTSCHGVHGAAPYGVGDVEKVCGACHQQVRQTFREGPHHEGMLAAGLSECASCHDYHAVKPFDSASLKEQCVQCHDEDSAQARTGQILSSLIQGATVEIEHAEELVREVKQIPLDVEDHNARIIQARTYLRELPTITHGLSVDDVETVARRARSVGEEVQHDIYAELGHRSMRRIGLVALWFYVLMTIAILVSYKRRIRSAGSPQ